MKLITENVEDFEVITEEQDGEKKFYISGPFMQAEVKNRNGRVYPLPVLENEVRRYVREKVNVGSAFGELGHPKGPTINADRITHIIRELKQDGNDFIGKAEIVTENEPGRIVHNLMKRGARLGVSSRGLGTLKESNGANVVQRDFYLVTAADIVTDPSAPNAFVEGIMEDREWIWEDGSLREVEVARQEVEKSVRSRSLDEERKIKIFNDFISKISQA